MYADTEVIRGLARSFREQGDRVRAEAKTLTHLSDAVPWTGVAAVAMLEATRVHGKHVRFAADLQDVAADALDRHARAVDEALALIAQDAHMVHDVAESAKHGIEHGLKHGFKHLAHLGGRS